MAASTTDLLMEVGLPGTATNLAGAGYTIGGDSIAVDTTTNWPTATKVAFAIDVVETDSDGTEVRMEGSYCEFTGIVSSGTTIANVEKTFGDDQNYAAGATTRVYIPVSSTRENSLVEWGQVHAELDGSLKQEAVLDALGVTTAPSGGWNLISTTPTVSSGYNKGNKEYDLTFDSVDLTSSITPGMRFKIDRTGTTPTQSTDLEASSSQYWSKSSPTGVAVTDDITCEAWIMPESYTGSVQTIVARRTAAFTSGFQFRLEIDGRLTLLGLNGGVYEGVTTYQSIPIGEKVHVAGSLDLSGNSYVLYINSVAVPSQATPGSGSLSAFTAAGDLTAGSITSGGEYFDGKMSDVRVWSTIRTDTEIRDNMNMHFTTPQTNLIFGCNFNGTATDYSGNGNNLTASGGAGYVTDNPFNTTEYGIVTKVAYSAPNTTVTVFTGTDYNIPNMTLQNPYYSREKSPYGFNAAPGKWRVAVMLKGDYTKATPAQNTWYSTELGSLCINIPTGEWTYGYNAVLYANKNSTDASPFLTLTSVAATESDPSMTSRIFGSFGGATAAGVAANVSRENPLSLSAQAPYYLAVKTDTSAVASLNLLCSSVTGVIYAECAYA